jgi:hypothetical protein
MRRSSQSLSKLFPVRGNHNDMILFARIRSAGKKPGYGIRYTICNRWAVNQDPILTNIVFITIGFAYVNLGRYESDNYHA